MAVETMVRLRGSGKGKDKHGGGRAKQFSAPEEIEKQSKPGRQNKNAGMMPPSDEEEEEEEEEEPVRGGGQNPNAGMMPPSDDDEDEDEDEDEDDEAEDRSHEKVQLQKILTSVGVADEIRKELVEKLIQWKFDEAASKPQKSRAPEPTRKKREAIAAKKKADESESEEEVDPAVQKRLEMVRKRREEQAAKRIAADGFDRMKPLGPDNHPPGQPWTGATPSSATDIS